MDKELYFEYTIRLFFGDKANNIAGEANNIKARKQWILKICKEMSKLIDNIETSIEHKELMFHAIESLEVEMQKSDNVTWHMIDILFRLLGHLLGFKRIKSNPVIFCSPYYFQDLDKYAVTSQASFTNNEKENFSTLRAKLVSQLYSENVNVNTIAKIFKIKAGYVYQIRAKEKNKD